MHCRMHNLMGKIHPRPLCVSLAMAMAGKKDAIGGAVWRVYVGSSSASVHIHVHACVHLQYPQNPSRSPSPSLSLSQFPTQTQTHSRSPCLYRTPSHNTQHQHQLQHQLEKAQKVQNMAYRVYSRSQSRGYSRNCPLDPQIQVQAQVQEGRETSFSLGWVWGVLGTPSVLRDRMQQRGKRKRRQSFLLIAVVLSLIGSRCRRFRWDWRGCYRWYW